MFGCFSKKLEPYPPPLALDELAEAFHILRGSPVPRQVVRSLKLSAQLPTDLSPNDWEQLAELLDCPLPSLEFGPGGSWRFPYKWDTVVELLCHAAAYHPQWQLPEEVTVREWVRAQIFVGVRHCCVHATGLPQEAIYREASFVNDLGLD